MGIIAFCMADTFPKLLWKEIQMEGGSIRGRCEAQYYMQFQLQLCEVGHFPWIKAHFNINRSYKTWLGYFPLLLEYRICRILKKTTWNMILWF